MDKNNIRRELYETLVDVATADWPCDTMYIAACDRLMKMLDEHVKSEVAKARLEAMKSSARA